MKQPLLVLLVSASAIAQSATSKKPDVPAKPEAFAANVSVDQVWESGEMKTCSTFFNHPKFLLCNDDVRMQILMHPEDASKIILSMFVEHSKRFMVQFSKLPWRLAPPDSDNPKDEPPPIFVTPDGKSPDLESQWDCSKEKTITCSLIGSH
jgi:hypothetical protein